MSTVALKQLSLYSQNDIGTRRNGSTSGLLPDKRLFLGPARSDMTEPAHTPAGTHLWLARTESSNPNNDGRDV